MASALAQDINQPPHQCGICLEPLNNPCELPCLHVFCEECLTRWARTNTTHDNTLTCPNCRQPAHIPAQGIAGFPTRVLIGSIQESGSMAEAKEEIQEMLCDNCEELDKKASVYCQNCKHYLCDTCQSIHQSWKPNKHHNVIALADFPVAEASHSTAEDKCCSDHDMENTSFCKTCDKVVCKGCTNSAKYCQDHDVATMKEAAEIKLDDLREEMKKCEAKKKECQDMVEKIEKIEREVYNSGDKIIQGLNKKMSYYIKQVKDVFGTVVGDVQRAQEEQTSKLDEMKYSLIGKITKIDGIQDQGKHLAAIGSHLEIVSRYKSDMACSIKKVNQMHINIVFEKEHQLSTNVPIPVFMYAVGEKWQQIEHLDIHAPYIAATYDDRIVAYNSVYSLTGEKLHTMSFNPSCVSISSRNEYMCAVGSRCKIYNNKFGMQHQFQVKLKYVSSKPRITALAEDRNGCIILGFRWAKKCLIRESDGIVKAEFATSITPRYLAVTSKHEIIVGDGKTLQLIDYTGKNLHVVEPPVEVTEWRPSGACCNKNNYVFVANQGEPKAVYKYANGRLYMGCVTTELNDPQCIALSHDDQKLFVGDQSNKVKIFQAP